MLIQIGQVLILGSRVKSGAEDRVWECEAVVRHFGGDNQDSSEISVAGAGLF